MKFSVYIATSLDGYIARADGDIDWLHNPAYEMEGEDFGFYEFMDSVDVLVMGRKTYEKVQSFGIEWPYGEKPVVVLSSQGVEIPEKISKTVTQFSGTTAEVVKHLEARGFTHAYLDGGNLIQSFLRDGLVNEMQITSIPILLGSGISLFGELQQDIAVELITSAGYRNGFVMSHYRLV